METLKQNTKKTTRVKRTDDLLNKLDLLTKSVDRLTNTYSNANGTQKNGCRIKIKDKIINSGVYGTILTLPHIACVIEKMILAEKNSYNFIGVERDEATFNAMRRTIKAEKLPIMAYKGSICDKIYGMERETYGHLILDYCGFLATISKEIQYTLQNKLVPVNGTIHITFAKNFRGYNHLHDKIRTNTKVTNGNTDLRCESEVSIRTFFDKVCGFDYELEEIFYYRDKDLETGKNKAPMCLVQIKRIA